MKITAIETIPVRVPLIERFLIRGSKGRHDVSPFLLVRVHTDEGLVGLGEASCTPRWSGEDQVTAAHFIATLLAPELVGEDPLEIEKLAGKMKRALAANPFTRAAIEMALWDIAGKHASQPVYRLLGGKRRDSVQIKWSVSGVAPEAAAGIARWAVAQGFRTLKVKVGIGDEQDQARVAAVREAAGRQVRIGIDANGAWTPPAAVQVIRRLRQLDICFAEQPVPPGDPDAMAEVRRRVDVPIIADESVYTEADARALARAGAADVLSVYVGKSAGIRAAYNVAETAGACRLAATIGSNLEMGVGTAAMLHLALAMPALNDADYPCDIIGPLYYEDSLLKEPLALDPTAARPPEKPGLGVELDEAKLERYGVRP